MMTESCTLALNNAYLDTDLFPRQRSRLKKLCEGLKRRGIYPKVKGVNFEGNDPMAVVGNIAMQIRSMMRDFYDGRVISFFGDSGGSPFLSAMRHNIDTSPVSGDDSLEPNDIIVAPGGSLNNLSRHLGTASKSDILGIISGEIPSRTQEIKIRNVTVSTFDGPGDGNGRGPRGNRIAEVSSDVTGFAGTGLDGFALNQWEHQPRSLPLAVRGMKTVKEVFKHLLGMDRPGGGVSVTSNSFFALPNMSLFYFGQEYDCLDKPYVHRISLNHEGAADVTKSFLVCMGIGLVPAINSALWTRADRNGSNGNGNGSGNGHASAHEATFSGIVNELKPRRAENDTIMIPSTEPFVQFDGFPLDLRGHGLRDGGHAEMEITTTPRSIYVARRAEA